MLKTEEHVTHTFYYFYHDTFAWHRALRMKKSLQKWEKQLTKNKTKWKSVISRYWDPTHWSWLRQGNGDLNESLESFLHKQKRNETQSTEGHSSGSTYVRMMEHLVYNFCVVKHIHLEKWNFRLQMIRDASCSLKDNKRFHLLYAKQS